MEEMMTNIGTATKYMVVFGLFNLPTLAYAEADKPSVSGPSEAAAEAPNASAVSSEILVTAQRRTERSLNVPVSIASLSPETLADQGINQLIDLSQAVTGLKMDKLGGGLQPAIRGISTQVAGPGSSSNVAIYVDGVYQPLLTANDLRLPNLDRIEVLKGPQGSLYGRNATGGAILVHTQNPSFTPTGDLSASFGSFNTVSGKAYLSGPLAGDSLAGSIAVYGERSDGYIDNLLTGEKANKSDAWQVRAKLLWKVTEDVSIQASAFALRISDPTSYAHTTLNGNTVGRALGYTPITSAPHTTSVDADIAIRNKQYGGVLSLDADLGFADLKAFTSYIRIDDPYVADGDGSPAPAAAYLGTVDSTDNYQQEITLSSNNNGRLSWLIGANYYNNNTLSFLGVPLAGGNIFNVNKNIVTNALAVFGEATLTVTDRLTVIAGYRFNTEKQTIYGINGQNLVSASTAMPLQGQRRWESGTPRLSVRYALTPDTNIYATYSEGFKSGQFDATTYAPIDPEKIKGYEIGIKSRELAGFTFDLAGFYYDYRDQQVVTHRDVNGVPLSTLANAAGSKAYGLDFTASGKLSNDLTVRTGLSVLRAEFTDFVNAVVNRPTGSGGNVVVIVPNLEGNALPRSPHWTLFVTADYSHDFNIGTLGLSATAYHSDTIYYDYDNRISQSPYTTIDARISFKPVGTRLTLSVYGRNLTDKAYIQSTFLTSLMDGAVYAPPRSVNFEAKYAF
jgi:iron complex outermembrane recepter protein